MGTVRWCGVVKGRHGILTSFRHTPNSSTPPLPLQGSIDEAERLIKRSQAILEKGLGSEHPQVAQLLNRRAVGLQVQVSAKGFPGLSNDCENYCCRSEQAAGDFSFSPPQVLPSLLMFFYFPF